MSTPLSTMKRPLAECAVAAALCVGGYWLLVAPAEKRLAEATSEIASLRATASAGAGAPGPRAVSASLRALRSAVDRVDATGRPARDESHLFTLVMELAARHRVRVDHLQPRQSRAEVPAPLPPPGAAPEPPKPKDVESGCTLSLTGAYADVVAFLDDLSEQTGYTAITSLRLGPADPEPAPMVRALVETRHHAFDLTALRTMLATGAEP